MPSMLARRPAEPVGFNRLMPHSHCLGPHWGHHWALIKIPLRTSPQKHREPGAWSLEPAGTLGGRRHLGQVSELLDNGLVTWWADSLVRGASDCAGQAFRMTRLPRGWEPPGAHELNFGRLKLRRSKSPPNIEPTVPDSPVPKSIRSRASSLGSGLTRSAMLLCRPTPHAKLEVESSYYAVVVDLGHDGPS